MCIIIQTINVTIIIYAINIVSWYSFMLIIVFLRGITIIFMYIRSLATNKIFFNKKTIILIIPITLIFSISIQLYDNSNISMNKISNYTKPNINSIYSIYSNFNSNLVILFILYLLITLIVVVKITINNKGPIKINL